MKSDEYLILNVFLKPVLPKLVDASTNKKLK